MKMPMMVVLGLAVVLAAGFGATNAHAIPPLALQELQNLPADPAYSSGERLRGEIAQFKARKPASLRFGCDWRGEVNQVQYVVYSYSYAGQGTQIPALYIEYEVAPGVVLYVELVELPQGWAIAGAYTVSDTFARAVMVEPFLQWLSLNDALFFNFFTSGTADCRPLERSITPSEPEGLPKDHRNT